MAENKLNRYWVLTAILLVAIILIGGIVAWSRYHPDEPVEITLPPREKWHGMINIDGAVTNPGFYPFTGGDTLDDLVRAAGGVTASAGSIELALHVSAPGKEHDISLPMSELSTSSVTMINATPVRSSSS